MHKKLGPLEAWQWAALLGGLVIAYYIYEYEKNNSASAAANGSSTDMTDEGAIDPTTGIPYADEIGSGAGSGGSGTGGGTGSTDSGTSLEQELSDLSSIEGLMQNLGLAAPTTPASGLGTAQVNVLNKDLRNLSKTLGKQETALEKLQKRLAPKKKAPTHRPTRKTTTSKNNPGHKTTTHANGKKTASSSAPHNSQQHRNIAPPSHQKAPPRKKARR